MPSHNRLGTNDRDRPQHIWLDVVEGSEKKTVPTRKLRPVSKLALKHRHLMAERDEIGLQSRSGNDPADQQPEDRLQKINHHPRMVASSTTRSRADGRIRFLVGTGDKFRRATLLQFFERAGATLLGMEACPGSHWPARKLSALGQRAFQMRVLLEKGQREDLLILIQAVS